MKRKRIKIFSIIALSTLIFSLASCTSVGPTGPEGDKGPTGEKGDKGEDGINGKNGTTWHSGVGAPSSSLGNDGDFYLNTNNGDVYKKDSTWNYITNVKGKDGADGTNGTNGSNGTSGSNGVNGSTAYSNTILPTFGGAIIPDKGSAFVGESITFTIIPEGENTLKSLSVDDVAIESSDASLTYEGNVAKYTTTMKTNGFVVGATFLDSSGNEVLPGDLPTPSHPSDSKIQNLTNLIVTNLSELSGTWYLKDKKNLEIVLEGTSVTVDEAISKKQLIIKNSDDTVLKLDGLNVTPLKVGTSTIEILAHGETKDFKVTINVNILKNPTTDPSTYPNIEVSTYTFNSDYNLEKDKSPFYQFTEDDVKDYYSGIDFSDEANLMSSLFNLLKDHNVINYDANNTTKWGIQTKGSAYFLVDRDYVKDPLTSDEATSNKWKTDSVIIDPLYMDEYTFTGSYSDAVNREHIWAKSHGFKSYTSIPAGTDLHHLRLSQSNANSSHSNSPFGVTTGAWDPPTKEDRGDLARACFYMATRYSIYESGSTYLVLNDNPKDGNYDATETNPGEYGILSTLLEWNKEDPVDQFELNRNNLVYSLQGNRNPFIDFPDLADTLFDSSIYPLK